MSKRNLKVSIAGLSILLEVDTAEGYQLLEHWLSKFKLKRWSDKFKKDTRQEFTIHFSSDEKRFKFGLEEGTTDNSGGIIQLRVGMGQIDRINKYAEGPDAAAVNRELAEFLFSNFLRITVQYVLPKFGGILVHASAVVDKRKSYVFIAPNEGGKTTVAQKTGKFILSDDCIGLNRIHGLWNACATPWGDIYNYGRYPVAGLFFIYKSDRLKLSRMDKLLAVKKLFSNVCISFPTSRQREPDIFENMLSILDQICSEIPVYNLWFRKEDNVLNEIMKDT